MEAFLSLTVVISLLLSVGTSEISVQSFTNTIDCFPSCTCEEGGNILCHIDQLFVERVSEFQSYLSARPYGPNTTVHFRTQQNTVPEFLNKLPAVYSLSLAENNISEIQDGAFSGLNIRKLILKRNCISTIHEQSFRDLKDLRELDLSYNHVRFIPKNVFRNVPHLEVLNLDNNYFKIFPFDADNSISSLHTLMLNLNQLSYLTPGILSKLHSLQTLEIRKNNLSSFVIDVAKEVPTLKFLDVSGNPFSCSCGVMGLKDALESKSVSLMETADTTCSFPESLRGIRVEVALKNVFNCTSPKMSEMSNTHSVIYTSDIELTCSASGDPDPAILWITPWGHHFADELHIDMLDSVCNSCKQKRKYQGLGIGLISDVSVLNSGKSLRIAGFRGFFNGNIVCIAFNYLGNDTTIHYVEVYSSIHSVVISSLFIGTYCAGALLAIGIIVGAIKMCVVAIKKRFIPKVSIIHTPVTPSVEDGAPSVTEESICKAESLDLNDDFYPPETPFTTPATVSPSDSPKKSHSPNGENTPPVGWLPTNILDSMEEVRWRLRYGVGRKMKIVKQNVQSIKESGSTYVHNIMESGSTAAHKVKAGVVLGMETVKFHVQSIKEFCGTGDMGVQTISMVSMETNVDTNVTREVVKSVTLV